MRKLLTTTAIVAVAASPLAAQESDGPSKVPEAVSSQDITVADVLDHTVYVRTNDEGEITWSDWTDVPDTFEASGEIDDLLLGKDGTVTSAILSQGGILDIGDTEVRVDIEKFGIVMDSDDEGEFFIVYTGKPSELKSAQPFEGPEDGEQSAANGASEQGQQAAEAGADNASETGKANMSETGAAASADSGKPADEQTEAASAEGDEMKSGDEMESAAAEGDEMKSGDQMESAAAEGDEMKSGDEMESAAAEGDAEVTADESQAAAGAEAEVEADDSAVETADSGAAEEGAATEESMASGDSEGMAAETTETAEADQGVEGASTSPADEQAAAGGDAATEGAGEEGLATAGVSIGDMTADDLEDMPVFSADDERVGEIGELKLGANGDITHAIVDMGGFLGLGETPVAVPIDKITIQQGENDGQLTAHVDMTQDAMKQLGEQEEGANQ